MEDIERAAAKYKCETSHLFFTRYFFKHRHGQKFIVNWHHKLLARLVDKVISGEIQNLVINIAPGSSKTEEVVINFIARGLAKNPRARFLHLSYSDDLAVSQNSQAAREIVISEEYQKLWPLKIASDSKSKKRWNVTIDGKRGGGVYATSLGGQITGFRAGHMAEGFQGAIIIDDPMKPEDAYSRTKLTQANRKLLTTVKSRKAHPSTPIVMIMQRISETDPTGFIEKGGLKGKWTIVKIPALMTVEDIIRLAPDLLDEVAREFIDEQGRFSYWQYKEPLADLLAMEAGDGKDSEGAAIGRHVFFSQYQQQPVRLGGNIIKGHFFIRYKMLPKIMYRIIYGDTAQKTKEANDYSVLQCWGFGTDGKIYLIDQIRGKWESPELKRRALAFWSKHKGAAYNADEHGFLRKMKIEDKSSGTGLIQSIKEDGAIPIEGIERDKDKYTRVMDGLPSIEAGMVCIPEDAAFTNDYVAEHEAFTADDTHAFDDQVDPTMDAIADMLLGNKLNVWKKVGQDDRKK